MEQIELINHTHKTRWSKHKDGAASLRRAVRVSGMLPKDVSAVTYADLVSVGDQLTKEGLSGPTVNRHLSAYSAVLNEAVRLGVLRSKPSLPRYKENRPRQRVLTTAEQSKVLEWFRYQNHSSFTYQYYCLVVFLANTGCRVSEAFKLREEDLNRETDSRRIASVRFVDTKNGTDRTVPLNGHAEEALRTVHYPGTSPFGGLSASVFNKLWVRMRRDLRINEPEFVPHALRHTVATRLVAGGTPLATVSRLLGHSSINTTMRYAHADQSALQKAVNTL